SGNTSNPAGVWPNSIDLTIRIVWHNGYTFSGYLVTAVRSAGDGGNGTTDIEFALRAYVSSSIIYITPCIRGACGTPGVGGEQYATPFQIVVPTEGDELEIRLVVDTPYDHSCAGLGYSNWEAAMWHRINGVQF